MEAILKLTPEEKLLLGKCLRGRADIIRDYANLDDPKDPGWRELDLIQVLAKKLDVEVKS